MDRDDINRMKSYIRHPKKGLNRFRLNGDIKNKRLIPASLPLKIELVITELCNLKCEMCFAYRETSSHMSLDLYNKIARELFPTAPIVFLIGGEPTLHPEFSKLVHVASSYGCKLQMTTNGTVLRDKEIPLIVQNFERINVSFDGGTKSTYEKIRKGAKFHKVTGNLKKLTTARDQKGSSLKIGFSFCSSVDNVHELPALVKVADDIGIDFIKVSTLKIHPGMDMEKSLYFHKDIANKYYSKAIDSADKLGIEMLMPGIFDLENKHRGSKESWKRCTYAWDRVRIKHDGSVVPCCNLMDSIMGNINESDFRSIWHSEKYQKFRQGFSSGDPVYSQCEHCRLIEPDINDPYTHIDQDPELKKQMKLLQKKDRPKKE